MAENALVICPKCGAENEVGNSNCVECHINLQWAFENYEQFKQLEDRTQQATLSADEYLKHLEGITQQATQPADESSKHYGVLIALYVVFILSFISVIIAIGMNAPYFWLGAVSLLISLYLIIRKFRSRPWKAILIFVVLLILAGACIFVLGDWYGSIP